MNDVAEDGTSHPDSWGGFRLIGAEASIFGWLAQWLILVGCVGLAVEMGLIEWGSGTWPQPDIPWISLGFIVRGMAVLAVDIIAVGFHNRMARRQGQRRHQTP